MATSTDPIEPNRSPPKLCRYFLSNGCRYGDKCFFSHDQSNTSTSSICRYYLLGQCIYGDRCRYIHTQPKQEAPTDFVEPVATILDESLYNPQSSYVVNHSEEEASSMYFYLSKYNQLHSENFTFSEPILYENCVPGAFDFVPQSLCPYAEKFGCCEAIETGRYCPYVHGDICDLCEMPALHPTNEQQREQHRLECLKIHEANCKEAFATQRSEDKKCGVCLETVWDRDGDKRFGILENCDHVFCLACIRTWRASSNYDHKVVKACPECRVKSDFVTPAKYWPENSQEKKDIIQTYKINLRKIHCKFFKRGDGLCPFGSKCFYLHVDKKGNTVELGPPRRRHRINALGEIENFSDVFMVPLFSPFNSGRLFDELDLLFDDEDMDSFGSYMSDEDDLQFSYGQD